MTPYLLAKNFGLLDFQFAAVESELRKKDGVLTDQQNSGRVSKIFWMQKSQAAVLFSLITDFEAEQSPVYWFELIASRLQNKRES